MQKMMTGFAVATLIVISGCATSHTASKAPKGNKTGTVADLHPMIHQKGLPPVLKATLPTMEIGQEDRRRLSLEAKYGWVKTRVSGDFDGAPLYTVLDLIIPQGRLVSYGDIDYRTPVSGTFSNLPLDLALERILKPLGANYIPHKNSIRITRTERTVLRLPVPDVQNMANGQVGNMLTASSGGGMMPGGGGAMPGGGGAMPGGSGVMPGGGGVMPGGSGSSSGSSGILSVNSISGMTPMWQSIVSMINGMVSGNCTYPLAVYTGGLTASGSSTQNSPMTNSMPGQTGTPGGQPGVPSQGFGPTSRGYAPISPMGPGGGGPGGYPEASAQGAPVSSPAPGSVSNNAAFSSVACGHVKVDTNTGYIYVWDTVNRVYDIQSYVGKLRRMLNRQVYLKVDIIEVQLSDQNQFGINWNAVMHGLGAGLAATFTSGAGSNVGLSTSGGTTVPYSLNVTNGSASGALVEALSAYGRVHIVNQPRILTISGQPSTINVTENIPYLQSEMPYSFGGLNSSSLVIPQIGYVTTGLTVEMMPEIDKDQVRLHIVPVLNTLTQFINITVQNLGTFQEPEVDSRATENDIVVRSNQAVFFGGLVADTINNQYWTTPFLGSIPGLKWLFSGYNKVRQVDELVFVVTPIITDRGKKIQTDIPSTHKMMHDHQDSTGIRMTPQQGIRVGPST